MFTSNDIKNVQFARKGKGYEAAPVDAFVNTVYAEFAALEARLAEAEAEVVRVRSIEASISSVLVDAENTATAKINEAEEQAQAMIDSAAAQSEAIIADAKARAASYEEESKAQYAELASQVEELKAFRDDYGKAVLADIDEMKKAFEDRFMADPMYEERPFEEEPEEEPVPEEEQPEEEVQGEFDINDILKDLPESETELRKMIDELL